jgi:hypothetical protein
MYLGASFYANHPYVTAIFDTEGSDGKTITADTYLDTSDTTEGRHLTNHSREQLLQESIEAFSLVLKYRQLSWMITRVAEKRLLLEISVKGFEVTKVGPAKPDRSEVIMRTEFTFRLHGVIMII